MNTMIAEKVVSKEWALGPMDYAKMMAFMLTIIDEREKLVENKAKGKDY